jgi:hypothetical protein
VNHLDILAIDGLGKAYALIYSGKQIEDAFCDEPDLVEDIVTAIFAKAELILEEMGL